MAVTQRAPQKISRSSWVLALMLACGNLFFLSCVVFSSFVGRNSQTPKQHHMTGAPAKITLHD